MLIVCPSCTSTYTLDEATLGSYGRRLRCAACRSEWFASSGMMRPAPSEPIDAEWQDAAPLSLAPPVWLGHRERAAPPSWRGAPRPRRRWVKPGHLVRRVGAVGLAVLVICAATATVFGREAVVRHVPRLAAIYAMAGAPVNLRGLEFHAVKSEIDAATGTPLLLVEGEVTNITLARRDVPPLVIAVRGPRAQPLYRWTTEPSRSSLDPGETMTFRARLAAPPADGTEVLVGFARNERSRAR